MGAAGADADRHIGVLILADLEGVVRVRGKVKDDCSCHIFVDC